jgi:circadian clock protein KaiC
MVTVKSKRRRSRIAPAVLEKSPTGISGFDEITGGGLPKGRPTLVCGSAGCGKTLFAMEFLVRGITEFNQPGVFIAFEENANDLEENVSSLGFNLRELEARKKLVIDHVRVERSEISETGEYDLEGLFIRIGYAIDSINAKRVVLDTIESLFAGLPNEAILRSELRRLFQWLKDRGVTAIITGERGEGTLTRHGLEEYVADCVILLDHRVEQQLSTRRLRIVKYRGSEHGTNEYPFLIGRNGISVLPITSLGLDHAASSQRISTGIERLDAMFGGKGYFRGASILVSGTAGTGKSSLAAAFALETCAQGERALYIAFEESPAQIIRNMASIGLDLAPCIEKGLLRFHAVRSSIYGLEMHLVAFHDLVMEFKPSVVIIDPITNLLAGGDDQQVKSMLTRLVDFFKQNQLTALCTSLTSGNDANIETSEAGMSSLMDTWIFLQNLDHGGERNRALYVLKSRGMPHSNQVREFRLSNKGIELVDVYTGSGKVLTGAARQAQEARDKAEALARRQAIDRLKRAIERKQRAARAQVEVLQAELESEVEELNQSLQEETLRTQAQATDRAAMAQKRMADTNSRSTAAKTSAISRSRNGR